jgi:SAM-dependent methyltransferase
MRPGGSAAAGPPPRYAYRLDLARRHFPTAGRLLDVGCGPGDWAQWIARDLPGLEPHGVDVVDGCTADIRFQVYDGRRLPYPDGHFDAIVVFSVLHHADDPEALVSEIGRVSRTGGRLIVVEDMASSRVQTFLTRASDLYGNRVRAFWRAITGARRWAMTRVPMTYRYRSYPDWVATFDAHRLTVIEMISIPKLTIEHGVFVLEKR